MVKKPLHYSHDEAQLYTYTQEAIYTLLYGINLICCMTTKQVIVVMADTGYHSNGSYTWVFSYLHSYILSCMPKYIISHA